MVTPVTIATMAYGVAIGLLMWATSKWQGIPIEELQVALAEKGLYHGRIDGLAGTKTIRAIEEAINDPGITIYPARLVDESELDDGPENPELSNFSKSMRGKRPPGGKNIT